VLFRRDFNLNVVTNSQGFAHRYIVHLAFPFNSGPGTILDKTRWDCGPDTFVPPAEERWESEVSRFLIFHFFVRVQLFMRTDSTYNKRVQIWETTSGLILEWRTQTDGGLIMNFPTTAGASVTFFNPAYFDHQPIATQLTVDPKFWSDGPPH